MAQLTTSFQLLSQAKVGTSGGTLYVRLYARYSQQDIANNRSYVIFQARTYYENGTYIQDSQGILAVSQKSTWYNSTSATRPTTGETYSVNSEGWVYHNSDGTGSSNGVGQIVFPNWGWNVSTSASATLPTIPRKANITSAPNFTDEDNPTITYSNLAGNSVSSLQACISLTGSKDDISYRDISKTGTSYTFNLTDDERAVLINATLDGSNTRTVKFFVRTVIGGNTYYSNITRTLTIANSTPIFTNFTYEDTNTRVTAITQDNQILVKGISDLKVTISSENKMTTRKNATPISYTTTIGTNIVNTNYSTSDLLIDVGTVSVGGINQLKVTAIDNRSNSTTVSKNVTVLDYSNITLSTSVKRVEPTTGEVSVNYSGNWFNDNIGQTPNQLSMIWKYKEHNAEEWINGGTITPTVENNTFSGTTSLGSIFNYQKQYDFKFIASDLFSDFATENSVAKGIPIFWWNEHNIYVPDGDISIDGNPISDFYEENGYSVYKFYNGTMIMCKESNYTNVAITTVWGNFYETSSKYDLGSYPEPFLSSPNLSITPAGAYFVEKYADNNKNTPGSLWIASPKSKTESIVHIQVIAIGRWK